MHLEFGRSNAFKAVRKEASPLGFVEAVQLFQSEKIEVPTATEDNELLLTRQTANKVQKGTHVNLIHLLNRIVDEDSVEP